MKNALVYVIFLFALFSDEHAYGMMGVLKRGADQWQRIPRWVKCVAGVSCVGSMYDTYRANSVEILDVSNPRLQKTLDLRKEVDENLSREAEQLTRSLTKRQLADDWFVTHGPLVFAKQQLIEGGRKTGYVGTIDTVLFSNFLVFNSNLRKKLTHFVLHLSLDEEEQSKNGRLSLVHGTNQGASILLRTIFDEILNDHVPARSLLRDQAVLTEVEKYSDVYDYYKEEYPKAPVIVNRLPASVGGAELDTQVLFDHGQARKHLLSTNFGFFGQSCWFPHGYKESSAEFLLSKCSVWYQFCDFLISVPKVWPFLILSVLNNPTALADLTSLIDRTGKGYDQQKMFQSIFESHGLERQYSKYRDELEKIQAVFSAGLIQLFIPEESASRWCYTAEPLGRMVESHSESNLADLQVRVLLHPELLRSSTLRFYLLGNDEEIRAGVKRMYEIAEELRILRSNSQD